MKPLGFTLAEMSAVLSDLEILDGTVAEGRLRRLASDWTTSWSTPPSDGEGWSRQLAMADEFIALLDRRLT